MNNSVNLEKVYNKEHYLNMVHKDGFVSALQYTVKVSESVFASIHGESETIVEYFVPAYNILFNRVATYSYNKKTDTYEKKYTLNVFETDKPRNLVFSETQMPEEIVIKMKQVIDYKNKKNAVKKDINQDPFFM